MADARDFVPDPNPVIVVSSGELGLISALAERGYEMGGLAPPRGEYVFDQQDVDGLVALIRQVDQTRDRSRIAKLCVYILLSLYDSRHEAVLRYFFEQTQALAQEGAIIWASQKQVYEAYVNWNR